MSGDGTWTPRLVAVDIDGTLVDAAGMMPDALYQAVQQVVDAGVPVVLATGRSWLASEGVAGYLRLPPGLHVCSNGAVVLESQPVRLVREVTFDPAEVIDKVVEHSKALIAVEELGVGYRVSGSFPDGELFGEARCESIEELKSRPVTRVVVRDPDADEEDFLRLAQRLGLHGVTYYIGWSNWLDIAPAGVDKAAGLEVVCERLGIDRADVLALGDGYNDIEMLQWAGRGVAIGDALPEVQQAADHVTSRFADGGTAEELVRWFPAADRATSGRR